MPPNAHPLVEENELSEPILPPLINPLGYISSTQNAEQENLNNDNNNGNNDNENNVLNNDNNENIVGWIININFTNEK